MPSPGSPGIRELAQQPVSLARRRLSHAAMKAGEAPVGGGSVITMMGLSAVMGCIPSR